MEMMSYVKIGGNIPDNMIKKDLVKSMCIGCNNIDNVLE